MVTLIFEYVTHFWMYTGASLEYFEKVQEFVEFYNNPKKIKIMSLSTIWDKLGKFLY